MTVSNTKLLDCPYELAGNVEVIFYCEEWHTFDKAVLWLMENGVLLTVRNPKDVLSRHRVVKKGKHPYADGKMLNHPIGSGDYASGEESGIRYEVHMPDDIRR